MFTINSTTGSVTVIHNSRQFSIRRNAAAKDLEFHHNLEGKDIKPALRIGRALRAIMKTAGPKSSYAQRFAKVNSALAKAGTITSLTVLANNLEKQVAEATA